MEKKNGTKNLIPLNKRTKDEQKEITKSGGIASGAARRKAKSLTELARKLSSQKITNEKMLKEYRELGLDEDDCGLDTPSVVKLLTQANSGNLKAIELWQKVKKDEELSSDGDSSFYLPAKLIGKAFCDVNRFIDDKLYTEYVFRGGRGSTKSSYISLKIIELLKNNKNIHALVARKVENTLRDSVYQQLVWAINILGIAEEFICTKNPLQITVKATKQTIYFRGADDEQKIKSIKVPFGYIGILWFEELDQFGGDEQIRSIQQSVIRGGDECYIFKSFNPPISMNNWANKYALLNKDKTYVHTSNYMEVPEKWLGRPFIDEAEWQRINNDRVYRHEYLGEAIGTGGNVFENVIIRPITDSEIESFDRAYQGLDWGYFPDPNAFVQCFYDTNKRILYIYGELKRNKTSNEEMAVLLADYKSNIITADSAEGKSIDYFCQNGFRMYPCKKGAGSVDYSMKWLSSIKSIIIDGKHCPFTTNEFLGYEYLKDREGNFISGYPDKDNHFIDATRYALNDIIMQSKASVKNVRI